tara:strand:- start:517 stop:999 length:483 start_codon:yes stop_codon:yes gene_type:complete
MKWDKVLNNWMSGKVLTYPSRLKHPFIWRTSRLDKNGKLPYKQEFLINKFLSDKQDYSFFNNYIKKTKNKYVVTFPNLSGDTILIVPIPKKGKNYAHIKNFIDNASITQQKAFWKQVVKTAKKQLKMYDHIWISTHGLGVPYLHVRISNKPKYYYNSKMI